MGRWRSYLLAALAVALVWPTMPALIGLLWGWSLLPADKIPGPLPLYSERVLHIAWRAHNGTKSPLPNLDGPVGLRPAIERMLPIRPASNHTVFAMRIWGSTNRVRLMQNHALAGVVMRLYMEHRWTVRESLSYLLYHGHYGRGLYGLDAATAKYFGLPPDALTDFELAQTIGLLHAPFRLDPLLYPARLRARARFIIGLPVCQPSRMHRSQANHMSLRR